MHVQRTHTQAFLFMTLILARIFPRQSSLSKAQSSAKRSEKAAERGVREKGKSHLHKSAQYSANKAPIYLRINHTPTIKAGDPSVGVTTEPGLCGGFVFFPGKLRPIDKYVITTYVHDLWGVNFGKWNGPKSICYLWPDQI